MWWFRRYVVFFRCRRAWFKGVEDACKMPEGDSEAERVLLVAWFNDYAGREALKARSDWELRNVEALTFGDYLNTETARRHKARMRGELWLDLPVRGRR